MGCRLQKPKTVKIHHRKPNVTSLEHSTKLKSAATN